MALASGCFAFSKKPKADDPVEFETVLTGQHSSIDTAAVFLIDNDEDWTKIWELAQGKIEPMPPVEEVDFNSNMILAIFMGQKTSGGYRNEIIEITRLGENLNVKVNNYSGGGGSMLPVLTSPYHIIQLLKGEYKIRVEYKTIKE